MGSESHLGSKSEVTRFESVVSGGVAGLVSRFVVSPLDVLKIRLQLQVHQKHQIRHRPGYSLFTTAKGIFKNEGIRAFWKGNVPAEAMYVFYGAVEFSSYKALNGLMNDISPSMPEKAKLFLSGSVAGILATCVTYPLDLLRTRFAAQSNMARIYHSIPQAMGVIYKTEGGIPGFYRGLGATLCSVVPNIGLFFMIYEETRNWMKSSAHLDVLPAPEVTAGLVAGTMSKTIIFPFDTIRKRLQVQGPSRSSFGQALPEYPRGVFKALNVVLRTEGIRGFYKGYAVSLLKSAPSSAVTVWAFENTITLLRWFESPSSQKF